MRNDYAKEMIIPISIQHTCTDHIIMKMCTSVVYCHTYQGEQKLLYLFNRIYFISIADSEYRFYFLHILFFLL